MPLYEYACKACANHFEALVRSSESPSCPACHSTTIERKLSVFAAHTNSAPARLSPPAGCGTCGDPRGPGACSLD